MFDNRRKLDFLWPQNLHPVMRGRRREFSIVLASLLSAVFVTDVCHAQEPVEFKGHQEVVYDAKFLPNGKSLVTASFDQTLKLWDVVTQ